MAEQAPHPPRVQSPQPSNEREKASPLLDMSNFDINAVLRGMQLTLVGGV